MSRLFYNIIAAYLSPIICIFQEKPYKEDNMNFISQI